MMRFRAALMGTMLALCSATAAYSDIQLPEEKSDARAARISDWGGK